MKKILVLLGLIMLFACSSSKKDPVNPTNDGSLSESEKEKIEEAIDFVNNSAKNILQSANPINGFNGLLNQIKQNLQVKNAWLTDDALNISFKDAGRYSWLIKPKYVLPPFGENIQYTRSQNTAKNKNVLLINTFYNDDNNLGFLSACQKMKTKFEAAGFATALKNTNTLTISFLKDFLRTYDLIVWYSLGFFDNEYNWIYTGQEASFTNISDFYLNSWQSNKIAVSYQLITTNNQTTLKPYYCVSDEFFASQSIKSESIFMFSAKQVLNQNSMLAVKLIEKGAKAVVGYENNSTFAAGSLKLAAEALLGSATIGTAVKASSSNLNNNLQFYPAEAADYNFDYSTNIPEISILTPDTTFVYPDPIIVLEGRFLGDYDIKYGVVTVNNFSYPLKIKSNPKNEFLMHLFIKPEVNNCTVQAFGSNGMGDYKFIKKEIKVKGNFENYDLQATLVWNSGGNYDGDTNVTRYTDLDLHLVKSGLNATIDDEKLSLFTERDCYYRNPQTAFNAKLFEDNDFGFGPEGIFLNNAEDGKYSLYVHGFTVAEETDAFISIVTPNGEYISEELNFELDKRDLWKIGELIIQADEANEFILNPVYLEHFDVPNE